MKRLIIYLTILALLAVGYFYWQSQNVAAVPAASVTDYLSGESSEGFAQVIEQRKLEFPRDLGAHPEFQTEWWYYTGNLEDDEGRQFGYQFTIFRRAIVAENYDGVSSDSSWRTNQIYFAHAAVADISDNQFLAGEHFSRGGAGLAGAIADPYEVWIEDWYVKEIAPGVHQMKAEKGGVGFEFELKETQPPVLQGIDGFSPKAEQRGKATYYYSLVGLETEGEIWIGENRYSVKGKSWKDHEVGTNFLPDDAVGWDWFSAQFDNGEALMYGQIRHERGLDSGGGSWISKNSSIDSLLSSEISIEVLETWESDSTGAIYPSRWTIEIPERNLKLEARTLINDAELLVGIGTIYWEGPAYYEGTLDGEPISGFGYIELTGYVNPVDL